MKKIFQIASYDFKRLMLNPFTMLAMIVVVIACLIFGAAYQIPTAPDFAASVRGETAREVYEHFNSSVTDLDTKTSLLAVVDEAKALLLVQKSCSDFANLSAINKQFNDPADGIANEVERYGKLHTSTYIDKNNIDEVKTASRDLKSFVDRFKDLDVFESNIIFSSADFKELEELSEYFHSIAHSGKSVTEILDDLYENYDKFSKLNRVVQNDATTWVVDAEKLETFESQYIAKAEAKLVTIEKEMEKIASSPESEEMESLVTNFKLTCESAKEAIVLELYLLLNDHFKSLKNLHEYQPIFQEETKIALTKINFFLNDESPYYTPHQAPLNFNTAQGQVSAYDKTYTLMSIIGFFTIIFGIFMAYKLFGSDRKNGKMDLLLSQDVTYSQVFAGKFLAIFLSTAYVLGVFLAFTFIWSLIWCGATSNSILAVFNLSSAYTIHPFLFMIMKVLGIQLQVIFYAVITIFIMNLSRKFELSFGISLLLYAIAIICNIFLNATLVYTLFPFIHADLTCFLGGGMMHAGFLQTPLYAYGSFTISLVYYAVVVGLLYNFTNQLFKKN